MSRPKPFPKKTDLIQVAHPNPDAARKPDRTPCLQSTQFRKPSNCACPPFSRPLTVLRLPRELRKEHGSPRQSLPDRKPCDRPPHAEGQYTACATDQSAP